jgi:hypothetical protein
MRSALGRSPLAGDRRDGLGLLRRPQAGSYRSRRGNVISADSTKLIERKTCRPKPMRSALGRSPLAGDRRDGLGLGCLNHNLLIFIKHFESHRDVFTLKLTPKEENNNLINMLY